MPRGATCSRPSKPITIVGRSTPLSVTSPHSRQTGKPHNPVSTVPGEGQTYTVADRRRSGKTSTPGGLTHGRLKRHSNLHQLDGRSPFRAAVNNAAVQKANIESVEYQRQQAQKTAEMVKIKAEGEANAAREQARGQADARLLNATAEAKSIQLQGEAQAAAIK